MIRSHTPERRPQPRRTLYIQAIWNVTEEGRAPVIRLFGDIPLAGAGAPDEPAVLGQNVQHVAGPEPVGAPGAGDGVRTLLYAGCVLAIHDLAPMLAQQIAERELVDPRFALHVDYTGMPVALVQQVLRRQILAAQRRGRTRASHKGVR